MIHRVLDCTGVTPEPQVDHRPTLTACPLCTLDDLQYQFSHRGSSIVRCAGCGLLMRNPQPSDAELAAIYSEHYFLGADAPGGLPEETHRLKRATAARQLEAMAAARGLAGGRGAGLSLLEVGCGLGNLLVEAAARGFAVTGLDASASAVQAANARLGSPLVRQGSLQTAALPAAAFDIVVMADVIEHTRDPLAELVEVWRVLRPGGQLFIAVPSLDSWSARLMKERWIEFKVEHLFFFDTRTMQSLLFRAGFGAVTVAGGWKTLSPEYIIEHFNRFPVPMVSPAARALQAIVPSALRRRQVSVVASGIDVLATRAAANPPARRAVRLTVIMPVYDEHATFMEVFESVYAKPIAGVEVDIIVVESGSSDGTRDDVRAIEGRPRVQVIYEERPMGKGHAVRAALARAAGDIILIQDGDREYDVNDYDQLVAPVAAGREAFVLGIRHARGGDEWKMQQFADSLPVRLVMKFGHALFRAIFNVVYGQRLRDPFTMYKVFRRECLHGLTFESNRFDFDWELVAKLLRAGYVPLEVPVNYTSRSFAEGKKVSLWRDPLTYLRACFKYRFVRLRT